MRCQVATGNHRGRQMLRRSPRRRRERLIDRVTQKDRAAVCLTGGSSPQGLYRLLAEEPWRGKVPWDRVHWFMGDDRFVPESDPLSNMGTARRAVSRSRRRAAAERPSDRDRCQLPRRRGAALRGRTQDILRRRPARSGAAAVRSRADGARQRRPYRLAVSALSRARRKRALGARRRQSRHGAVRAARHVDVSGARLDARNAVPRRRRRQARNFEPRPCPARTCRRTALIPTANWFG